MTKRVLLFTTIIVLLGALALSACGAAQVPVKVPEGSVSAPPAGGEGCVIKSQGIPFVNIGSDVLPNTYVVIYTPSEECTDDIPTQYCILNGSGNGISCRDLLSK